MRLVGFKPQAPSPKPGVPGAAAALGWKSDLLSSMANASLAPVLLVSMPQMTDPNFSKTVILLAEYGAHGAFGLVLNRRMNEPARAIITADEPIAIHPKMRLFAGGPVEPTRAWILTAKPELDPEALEVMLASICRRHRRWCARHWRRRPTRVCAWWSVMPAGAPANSTPS